MNPDSIENKLRGQPPRKLPGEWRQEILASARNEIRGASRVVTHTGPPWFSWLREALWPNPVAWGAMACLWMTAFFLSLSVSEQNGTQSEASAPSPLERRLAKEQREFIAEEFGISALPAIWNVGAPRQVSGSDSRTQRDPDAFGAPEQCAITFSQKEFA